MEKIKISITILMIIAMLFILMPKSNAALQSNENTGVINTVGEWMVEIRKMEGIGGTLGLVETTDPSTLLSTSGSNNLDIHMIKNTEYGAIAILSASSYGNPNIISNGDTTTGNETGIIMNLNNEWVAAGSEDSIETTFINANSRYKNVYYTTSYIAKKGDAIVETAGWHGSARSDWFNDRYQYSLTNALVLRAMSYGNSIFSYESNASDSRGNSYFRHEWYSRAIMICGEGI